MNIYAREETILQDIPQNLLKYIGLLPLNIPRRKFFPIRLSKVLHEEKREGISNQLKVKI